MYNIDGYSADKANGIDVSAVRVGGDYAVRARLYDHAGEPAPEIIVRIQLPALQAEIERLQARVVNLQKLHADLEAAPVTG